MKHRIFYAIIFFSLIIGIIWNAEELKSEIKYKSNQSSDLITPIPKITPQEYQKEVVSLVNIERTKGSLKPLIENPELDVSAKYKAADMFAKNYWAHNAPDGTEPWVQFTRAGYNYLYAGENLARNYSTPVETVFAWMNSPAHRSAILNPEYTDTGVSVVEGKINDRKILLVVEHFATPLNRL